MIDAENVTQKHRHSSAAALTAAALILIVVGFQWALAFGAPWGEYTQGGAHQGQLPAAGRIVALVSSAVLLFMAVAVLARAGLGPMRSSRRWMVTSAAWFSAAYFGLAVLLNIATPSASERLLWLPISVAIWLLVGITIWSTRARPTSTPTIRKEAA